MALEHVAGAALTHIALKSLIYGCISTRAGYLLSTCSNFIDHLLRVIFDFLTSWPNVILGSVMNNVP